MALRALSDFVRTSAGAGINAASYVVTRLVDDTSIASGVTAADADPLTDLDGFFDEDETTIGYNGPLKYVVTTSTGTRTHTSKSTGVVGSWRTLDVTRVWRLHGRGVVPGILSDLAVTTNGANMVVSVAAGEYLAAIVDHGLIYSWPAARTITATASDPTQPRIDTMCLRFYPPGVVEEGRIDLVLRAGTAAASPAAVSLHQSTDYWEEALADIRVDATVTSLAANKVTDRRTYLMLLPSTMTFGNSFYVDSAGKLAQLAGNTTTTKKYLSQTGDGTLSGAPAWGAIPAGDLPTAIDATKIADGSVTNAEFQFLASVTSDVQTQLNAKAPLAAPVFTGQPTIADFTLMAHDHGDADDGGAIVVGALPNAIPATKIGAGVVDDAEFGYLDGVTSAIQGQIAGKQPLDADLTTIAGLTPTTDSFMVAVASAWASRTPTQVKTTLALVPGTDVQAYSSILAGIVSAGLGFLGDYLVVKVDDDNGDQTNTSTSADVDGISTTIVLGTGTWTLYAVGGGTFTGSVDGMSVVLQLRLDGTDGGGNNLAGSGALAADRRTGIAVSSKSSVTTGTKTCSVRFRSTNAGTLTCDQSWIAIVAIRTA